MCTNQDHAPIASSGYPINFTLIWLYSILYGSKVLDKQYPNNSEGVNGTGSSTCYSDGIILVAAIFSSANLNIYL